MVFKFLQAGADINARGGVGYGLPALSAASTNGRLDVIHLLIESNPHRQKLKYECSREAKQARFTQNNQIARILENFVASLTAELGRDEMDAGIDGVYACYIGYSPCYGRSLMCSGCQHLSLTEPRRWLASVLYFGNVSLPWKSGFRLKRGLIGDETLEEIEDLMECGEEEDERGGNDNNEVVFLLDSDEGESSWSDEKKNSEGQENNENQENNEGQKNNEDQKNNENQKNSENQKNNVSVIITR